VYPSVTKLIFYNNLHFCNMKLGYQRYNWLCSVY